MEWLFWFVVLGMGLALVAGVLAWLFYPMRQQTRKASASSYRDPVTGDWVFVPKTRRELWRG